jgi:hypothetical protein
MGRLVGSASRLASPERAGSEPSSARLVSTHRRRNEPMGARYLHLEVRVVGNDI